MTRTALDRFALLLLAASVAGCQSIGGPGDITPESLLQVAESSPDAVTLDIYLAKRDIARAKSKAAVTTSFDDALWSSVQEDRIPVELRNALAENGLRAGVVGGTPSRHVMQLLNPSGVTPNERDESDEDGYQIDEDEILVAGKVTRNLRQLRPGRRAEILTSDVPRTVPLLRREGEYLIGDTFTAAQGVYALQVVQSQGQQVELQLTPELHHGEPRMKYTPLGPGMVTQRLAREIEVFSELNTKIWLAPGEMLLVSSLPDPGHKLGGLLHRTSNDTSAEQQYLLVRLSQIPKSDSLAAVDGSVWPWR